MTARVSKLAAEVIFHDTSGVRSTRLQVNAILNDRTLPVRSTRVQMQVMYADRTKPVRITYLGVQILRSVEDAPATENPLPAIPEREYNPYRPTLPDEIEALSPVLFDHMREQVETIRLQHNTTQAGDSTFPWELLTKIGPERQFTLGSLGRFYHDDYGIILARYCQFARMAKTSWGPGPVGFLNTDGVVTWRVTNNPAFSNPDRVAGIVGALRQPEDGWYGWVLTQGANHTALLLDKDEVVKADSMLMWSDFEEVSAQGLGRVLGRTLAPSQKVHRFQNQLPVGSVMLGLEGPSIQSLAALLGDSFGGLEDQIRELQAELEKLDVDNLLANLNELVREVNRQGSEIDSLRGLTGSLTEIRRRITLLEQVNSGDALYLRIMGEIGIRLDALSARIDAINPTDYAGAIAQIQLALDQLRERLDEAEASAYTAWIPLVTGTIPPELVYLPDGSLVLVGITP